MLPYRKALKSGDPELIKIQAMLLDETEEISKENKRMFRKLYNKLLAKPDRTKSEELILVGYELILEYNIFRPELINLPSKYLDYGSNEF